MAFARQSPAFAAALMATAVLCFTVLDAVLKCLALQHGLGMVIWARYASQVVIVMGLLPWLGLRRALVTRRPGLHLARGVLFILSTGFIVAALRVMPMVQAYAITLSMPLFATALAALVLRERPPLATWALIGTGFVGVVIALRPGAPDLGWEVLLPLGMALSNAGFHVLTRIGGRHEDPLALLFYVSVAALAMTSLTLPWTWELLPLGSWGLVGLVGLLGTGAHVLIIEAFRRASTAVVSPMVYTQIIWATVLGWAVFGESPDAASFIGGAIVVTAGVLLARRPAREHR